MTSSDGRFLLTKNEEERIALMRARTSLEQIKASGPLLERLNFILTQLDLVLEGTENG